MIFRILILTIKNKTMYYGEAPSIYEITKLWYKAKQKLKK